VIRLLGDCRAASQNYTKGLVLSDTVNAAVSNVTSGKNFLHVTCTRTLLKRLMIVWPPAKYQYESAVRKARIGCDFYFFAFDAWIDEEARSHPNPIDPFR